MNGKFTVLPARVFEFSDGNLVSFLISFERSVYKKMYFIIQLAYTVFLVQQVVPYQRTWLYTSNRKYWRGFVYIIRMVNTVYQRKTHQKNIYISFFVYLELVKSIKNFINSM